MLEARYVPLGALARMKHDHAAVMAGLYAFADRDGKCWPSLRTLAEFCAMSKTKVQRAVKEMVALGYIAVQRSRSFIYRIADHLMLKDPPRKKASAPPAQPAPEPTVPHMERTVSEVGTEGEAIERVDILKEEKKGNEALERDAPRGVSATDSETISVSRKWAAAACTALEEKLRRVDPWLKKTKKEALRCKLWRYINARLPQAKAYEAGMGLLSDDPVEAQRWFDQLDKRMRAERWDDVPRDTWKRL